MPLGPGNSSKNDAHAGWEIWKWGAGKHEREPQTRRGWTGATVLLWKVSLLSRGGTRNNSYLANDYRRSWPTNLSVELCCPRA